MPRLLSITDDRSEDGYKNGASVSITSGQTHNLTCSVQDARPSAELEWQIPGEVQIRLEDQYNAIHGDAYTSRRVVSVTPSRDDDGKIFSCVASHQKLDNGLQLSIHLDVQVPPRDIRLIAYGSITTNTTETTSATVSQDSATLFTCKSVGSRPTAIISWVMGLDNDLGSTSSMSTTNEADQGLRDTKSTLQLIPKRLHHNKLLRCVAIAGMNQRQTEVTVIVRAAPFSFRKKDERSIGYYQNNPNITVTAGEPHDIACTADGARPPAVLEWRIPDGVKVVLQNQSDVVQDNSYVSQRTATITPSTSDQGKNLRCVASHPELQSNSQRSVYLEVQVPPNDVQLTAYGSIAINVTETRSVNVFEDSATSFTCNSVGSRPKAVISWIIGSDDDLGSTTSTSTTNEADQSLRDTKSILQLIPRRRHHNKLLRCVAHAGINQSHTEVRVIVFGPPDPPYLSGMEWLQDGVSSNVTCTSNNGYPAPTFQWYLGSKNVTKDSNTESSRNIDHRLDAMSVLNITPTVDEDAPPSWFIITSVRSSSYLSNTSVTVSAEQPYDITCEAYGARPPSLLEWRIPDDVTVVRQDQSDVVRGKSYVSQNTVTITPSRNEQGKNLGCVASHPKLHNDLQRSVQQECSG
eukprot:XP_001200275.1 PREDICTED: nephrin-like [Strongylocentrotus purpuratus]